MAMIMASMSQASNVPSSPSLPGSPMMKFECAPSPTSSVGSITPSSISRSASKASAKENQPDLLRCKRRIDFNGNPVKKAAVARRNERERNRVKLVNLGFATLREHVPAGQKNKKMSKVDTLKSAVDYIKYLQTILDNHDASVKGLGHQVVAMSQGQSMSLSSSNSSLPQSRQSPMKSEVSPPGSVESVLSTGYGSDTSEVFSPEEEELLDFASWFH